MDLNMPVSAKLLENEKRNTGIKVSNSPHPNHRIPVPHVINFIPHLAFSLVLAISINLIGLYP